MSTLNPKVDQYIAKSAEFARPILTHIRDVVHAAAPAIIEEIKWGFPFFTQDGEIVCAMRGFKAHCGLFFWKGALVVPDGQEEGMGQFGKLTSVEQLPSKRVLTDYVKKALQLNEAGVPAPYVAARRAKAGAAKSGATTKARPTKSDDVPPALLAAIGKNKTALATWKGFAPSHRREYAEWVADAKRDETKGKRIAQAVEWIAEGRQRNWKYQK